MCKWIVFAAIIGLPVLSVQCAKNYELLDADRKYLITESELVTDIAKCSIKPLKTGKRYFFSRSVNDFGLYVLYSITLTDSRNNELKLVVRANKFYGRSGIERLYASDAFMKKINGDYLRDVDFKKYNFEKGFYIDKNDFQMFEVVRGTMIYAVQTEGFFKLNPDKLVVLIDTKMKELEQWK